MREQCFSRNDSNPPVCGVHQVAVVQRQVSIDPNAPGLGRVTCSMCPVSKAVVREVRGYYARNSR
jgi:hypothetical protein